MTDYKKAQVYSQAFHISLSSFNFLYTLTVFNSCTDNVSASLEWGDDKATFVNLFSTIVMIGLTIGSLFTAYALNTFGRRLSLIYCDIAFIIGSFILVMPHTVAFGTGRAITSLSLGVSASVSPIFLLETSPIPLIPSVGPILTIIGSLGILCANLYSLFLPYEDFSSDSNNQLWIFLFLFPALVSLYQLSYFLFFQKLDSPQFYFSKNLFEKTCEAVKLTHNESGFESGMKRLNSEVKGITFGTVKLTLIGMFKQKRFNKMFRVGSIMAVLQQLCGTTAIMFYSTTIFRGISSGLFMSRIVTALLGLVYLLGSAASLLFMRKFGRKSIIMSAMAFISVDLILLSIFSEYVRTSITIPAVFLISYNFFFSYGLNSVFILYMSEILNDQIYGITTTLKHLSGVLVASVFPIAVDSLGLAPTLLFFAVCMIIGLIYSHFELIETKGSDKEEILIKMKAIVIDNQILPTEDQNNIDSNIRITDFENEAKTAFCIQSEKIN